MKIYIVNLESNVDGALLFKAIPCATEEIAQRILKQEKEWIMKESYHFSVLSKEARECMEIEDTPNHFFINDPCDDYYEDYTITEEQLREK